MMGLGAVFSFSPLSPFAWERGWGEGNLRKVSY